MGTPILPPITPDPVAAGNACALCWGAGKEFGDQQTPASIQLEVSGTNKGPLWTPANAEPLEGVFTMVQSASPCGWVFGGPFTVSGNLSWDTNTSFLLISLPDFLLAYRSLSTDQCETFFPFLGNDIYIGGSGRITVPEVG